MRFVQIENPKRAARLGDLGEVRVLSDAEWASLSTAELAAVTDLGDGGTVTQPLASLLYTEQSLDPSAPAADTILLYAKDDGDGATQLFIRNSANVQQIVTIEPISHRIEPTAQDTPGQPGKQMLLSGGLGNTTGVGGNLNLDGGNGGSNANGGNVNVTGGNAGGGNRDGGNVVVNAGVKAGSGAYGSVQLWDGNFNEVLRVGPVQSALAFFGGTGSTKPTITGSRGANAAVASLLTALALMGLVTDSTTA